MLNTATNTGIYGAIIGFVWAFALKLSLISGLLNGAIIGFVIGLLLVLLNKSITSRGNVNQGEAGFITNSLLTLLLIVGVVTALVAWVVRLIFF